MSKVYNQAADLLVLAYKMKQQSKHAKALECAELALSLPSMRVIAKGLDELNDFASEIDDDEDIEVEESNDEDIDVDVEESSDEQEEDNEDIDVDVEESSDDEDVDVDIDEDVDEEDASDDEDIDVEEVDEVLSSLRNKYKVKSSIVTVARRKKAVKKAKACGCKSCKSSSKMPNSTMAKLRAIANKASLNK